MTIQIVAGMIIFVMAVMVAMDARERGARKEAGVLWAMGIVFFFPVVLVYLLLRARRPAGAANVPETPKPGKSCPYCGGLVGSDEKLCRRCGRLL